MGRNVLAGFLGVLAHGLVVLGLESITHRIWPPPAGLDLEDTEALRELMANIPPSALIAVLAAWLIAAFVGANVAGRIAIGQRRRVALIAGLISAVGAGLNLSMIPHPAWFVAGTVLVYGLGVGGGVSLVPADEG